MTTLSAFWNSAGFDRTDILLGHSFTGETCIDYLITNNRLRELTKLFTLKRNDVIERLLFADVYGDSLLVKLENNNMQMAQEHGLDVEEIDPDKAQAVCDRLDESGVKCDICQRNNLMKIIAYYVNEANLSHLHVHSCFAEGKAYSEYNGYNLGEETPENMISNASSI
jgi:hypothetical protein